MSSKALLRARVDWFHASKPIGVASTLGDSKKFGIHLFQLRGFTMGPEGHPVLLKTTVVEERRPQPGQEVFVLNTGRTNANSQAVAEIWGFADECDQLQYEDRVRRGGPKRPMPLQVAIKFLNECDFNCLKDHAFGDEEFGWHRGDEVVAYGGGKWSQGISLCISESECYAATSFDGDDAKKLYECGKTRNVDRNDEGDPREW